ncbi:ATP-binding protein [Solimicrobium silvestre]|uniref:Uncharacterized protein n=1 Tax=Solimicrobium silvestre TaxID=2099400 RepID=A0A2S9GZE0_9BURK|nr:ATP-binding protein [Solimicrobium silvestre]PRC93068.1 hypothetical protein S2091_2154 [Solimicrobium silvestre]
MESTIQNSPVLIYGEQGCGKTRHATALAKAFNKSTIVDEFIEGEGIELTEHDIAFTNVRPVNLPYIPFAFAMLSISQPQSSEQTTPPTALNTPPSLPLNQSEHSHLHTSKCTQDQASLNVTFSQPELPSAL